MAHMASIWIENEWSQLKEVLTGSAATILKTSINAEEMNPDLPLLGRVQDWIDGKFFAGRPVNKKIQKAVEAEVHEVATLLLDAGVTVKEVDPVTPLPDEPLGLNQLYPRDLAAVIGNVFVRCRIKTRPARQKEERGIDALVAKLITAGVTVFDAQTAPDAAILEGGDILVDLPYVFVGQGAFTSNALGAAWLQDKLSDDMQVIPVPLTRTTSLHLDCALSLIGPKTAIADLSALPHPLPHPLDTYDIIDVGTRAGKRLATNVLVIKPNTILISSTERALQHALELRGWRVHMLPFKTHLQGGGGLRCATLPLRRAKL